MRAWLTLALVAGCAAPEDAQDDPPAPLVVVTFNTGTTEGVVPNDATVYTDDDAAVSDVWYGDGLAFLPALDAAREVLATLSPDVVAFQEAFDPEACPEVPVEAHEGFVCEDWAPGDPSVLARVLGEGWQVGCHPGKPDKCLAVRRDRLAFEGCDADRCDDVVQGFGIEGCGSGARVAFAPVRTAEGAALHLVSVHGSSGLSTEDRACRQAQAAQVFEDAGDGMPAARGALNLVLGDLNTDPGRAAEVDASAAAWRDGAADGGFAFHSDVGPDAVPTYGGLANIDHVLSDGLTGGCTFTAMASVWDVAYFDHGPVACTLTLPDGDAAAP